MSLYRGLHLAGLGLAPDEARGRRPQIPRTRIQCPQRRKVRAQAGRSDLKYPHRRGQVPQPPCPQVHQVDSAQQSGCRVGREDLTTVPGGHQPCGAVEHRAEVVPVPQLGLARCDPHPHRRPSARWAAMAASTADLGEENAATTPSPVWVNKKPSYASIALRNTSSCASRAARIPSALASHRRVEPSISVNRNVTTPDGGTPADTRTGCHTQPSSRLEPRLTFQTLVCRAGARR